jgi:hypothetical protein
MPVSRKGNKEELVRELFVALADKWDVHDRSSARNLAEHCLHIADGYFDVMDAAFASKKPEKIS